MLSDGRHGPLFLPGLLRRRRLQHLLQDPLPARHALHRALRGALRRAQGGACRRILRTHARSAARHVRPRLGQRPRHGLRRARAHDDLLLRARGHPDGQCALDRGGREIPHLRLGRDRCAPLRHQPRLRHDGQPRLRRHREKPGALPRARHRGHGAHARRLLLQALHHPVPPLGTRRLRRCARARHRTTRHVLEGGGHRRHAARDRHGTAAGGADVDRDPRDLRLRLDGRRQPHGVLPVEHQAHARLLLHRAGRLHDVRDGGGKCRRPQERPLLRRRLPLREHRGIRHGLVS